IDEAKEKISQISEGQSVVFADKTGKVRIGSVRIKEVRCGKKNCHTCPHKIYAYARYRVGKKVTEKYIGKAN
ncbi:hypothetical protein LCGC14_3103430, partial [marine sediment metagenome]